METDNTSSVPPAKFALVVGCPVLSKPPPHINSVTGVDIPELVVAL